MNRDNRMGKMPPGALAVDRRWRGRCARLCRSVLALLCLSVAPILGAQTAAPPAPLLDAVQLDQLLAPIALYPDEVLGPILMAATYPLDIVEADRWLRDPGNAALRGPQLVQALQRQPWDPSVKSLVAFPQVLSALDNNLDWTEAVGNAFVAQQAQVMDRIQQLRQRAEAARTLVSSPQQVVRDVGSDIEIHPPGNDMVYVPQYDPNVVYGMWPYANNPPDDFELPDFVAGGFIGFVVLVPYWGWSTCDWRHHRIGALPPGAPVPRGGPASFPRWHHDPGHRRGAGARDVLAAPRVPAVRPEGRAAGAPRAGASPPGAPVVLPSMPEAPRLPAPGRGETNVPRPHAPPELRAPAEVRPAPPQREGNGRVNPGPGRETPRTGTAPAVPIEPAHAEGGREHR